MVTYNGIVGIDEVALNRFISGVYDGARKTVFHGTVPVAHLGLGHLEEIEFDVATTPRATLVPPKGAPATGSQAAFGLVVDDMTVILHYTAPAPPTTLTGTVSAIAQLVAGDDGLLKPELTSVTVELPDNQTLAEIATEILIPFAAQYASTRLLDPIRVPPIAYREAVLSPPVVRTVDGRLLITSAIAPAVAELALAAPWPDGRLFVAADAALINRVLAAARPDLTIAGHWSKTLKLYVAQSTVKADYRATVMNLAVEPGIVGSDQLTGKARVAIRVHAWAKRLFDVTTDATVDVTATARPVFEHGSLAVKFTHLDRFTVKLDLPGVPGWLDKQVGNFLNAEVAGLADPLSAALAAQPAVPIDRLPSFELDVLDAKLAIGVTAVEVTTIITPDGHTLVMASAVPEVHAVP